MGENGFVVEGIIYKDTESNIGYVVRRGIRLYSDRFLTFRPGSPNSHSKLWRLQATCILEPSDDVVSQTKRIRPKKTFTAVAALRGTGKIIQLYCFSVEWPITHSSHGYKVCTLGFEKKDKAMEWHAHLNQVIKSLSMQRSKSDIVGATMIKSFAGPNLERPSKDLLDVRHSTESLSDCITVGRETPGFDNSEDDEYEDPVGALESPSSSCNPLDDKVTPHPMAKRWIPFKHSNGVAIYYHQSLTDEAGVGGEYMVSSVVRGSPEACRVALTSPNTPSTILGPASHVSLVARDKDAQILRIILEPQGGGFASMLCAPREVLVQQVQKKEEHNIQVILFSSIDKIPDSAKRIPESPESAEVSQTYSSSWFRKPVRASVRGVYTISPLEGCTEGDSPEALVTCILKVDLGSVLSERSIFHRGTQALGLVDAFMERMLMTVILVKDEVEHQRFSSLPLNLLEQDLSGAGNSSEDVDESTNLSSTTSMEPSQEVPAGGGPHHRRLSSLGRCISLDPCGTCNPKFWGPLHEPGHPCFARVRAASYLETKMKVPAGPAQCRVTAVDLVYTPEATEHIARFLPSLRVCNKAAFSFVVVLIVPGTPVLNLAMTFSTDKHPDEMGDPPKDLNSDHTWTPYDFVLHRFLHSSDDIRDGIFKLIPHISKGSWLIKQSVGTTPVIIGRKLKTSYHLTKKYIEIDIDVTTNKAAAYIVGMVKNTTKLLVVDLVFLLEGQFPHELPESLIGGVSWKHVDLESAVHVDTTRVIPMEGGEVVEPRILHTASDDRVSEVSDDE